jgi:NADPH:quinone reductase-like Zn-dependent oxidoreductase
MIPLFTSGALGPIIDKVFPMKEVEAAHDRMKSNENVGKILLKV